ncbi:MAG: Rieske 2Fe-2S domain-containing protein [Xenococcaceae cyanobacterium MO_188.B19]|nr:Rieske 2Fe-2S domain-containing protein [Xenococcaceae cyanobacterium MO_188.B19]
MMNSQFNFFQQWYPLSPIEDLDPTRPTPVTILGLQLVIWKSPSSDTFRVFLDQCPHRLAPLSEGIIDQDTGNLMCSYHGWQFDEQGVCKRIPQAENPDLLTKNQSNLCAVPLPSRQENDLLWVWTDSQSFAQAEKTPLPLSPQIDASKGFIWSSKVRDLEYDWQTLIENVADPSHVNFAHHGIQGDRKRGKPIPIKIAQSTVNLIEAKTDVPFKTVITFEPPCRLEYEMYFGGDKQVGLITYCIPVTPGKSRIIAQFSRNFAQKLHYLTPRWWDHIQNRNSILDGDMVLLHQQEYFLQQRQKTESWKTAYQLPTSADRLVIEFRQWFDRYCEGKIPWQEVGLNSQKTQIISDRKKLLDRYHQHTKHCSSCRNALKNIQRLQVILAIYFIISVSGVALIPDSLRLKLGLPLIIVALLGLGLAAWLRFWLQPRFYFIDYIHADK